MPRRSAAVRCLVGRRCKDLDREVARWFAVATLWDRGDTVNGDNEANTADLGAGTITELPAYIRSAVIPEQ